MSATAAAFSPRYLSWQDYGVLVVYFSVVLTIGWWSVRNRNSSTGFFLGNGRLGWFAAAVSFFATKTSSISFMALPAKTFQSDWLTFGSAPAQSMAGLVVGFFLVRTLRRLNITTVYGYLAQRYDLRVQLLGAALGILLKVGGRMSVVMLLPAMALSTVSGLNFYLSILLMGLVTTVYAMRGGFESVVWTEILQVVVTYGGVLVALFILVSGINGGVGEILSKGLQEGKFHLVSFEWDLTKPTVWVFIGMFLGHIFTQLSDQSLMQRMLATSDETQARRSILAGNLLGLASSVMFFFMGTALYFFYQAHPDRLAKALPNDAIFPFFIANELPRGLVGLVIAGLFAAAMGSISSIINSTAAIVVTDFQAVLHPAADEKQRLRLARLTTLLCGLLGTGMATFLAYRQVTSLWDEFLRLVALVGGGFPGVFALGLLTKRAHSTGVIIGTLSSIVITWWIQQYTATSVFLHGFVAVGSCMAIGYVVSCVTPAKLWKRSARV